MDVVLAVELPGHGPPAVGAGERPGADVLRHVQLGPFEVVAHERHHVGHAELAVGLDPERERGCALDAAGVVARQLEGGRDAAEDAPDAGLAEALGPEVEGRITLTK